MTTTPNRTESAVLAELRAKLETHRRFAEGMVRTRTSDIARAYWDGQSGGLSAAIQELDWAKAGAECDDSDLARFNAVIADDGGGEPYSTHRALGGQRS
jgi:hypothetical protein